MKLKLGPMEYEIAFERLGEDNLAEISYRTHHSTENAKENIMRST